MEKKKLSKQSLLLTTSLLVRCLGVCLLLLFPSCLLAMLTQDRARVGTAVAFEDLMKGKEVLPAVESWEPGQAAQVWGAGSVVTETGRTLLSW